MRHEEVFIIGGGPSLREFPFRKLNGLDTIAVNVAALDVPNPTYSITADSGTFRKIQEGYFKNVKTCWVLVTNPNHCSMKWENGIFRHKNGFVYNLFAVNMVIRNAGTDGIGFSFDDFRTGYSSGFCAFQLAVLLGYKKIYLLGIDLQANDPTHYHKRYGSRMKQENLKRFYDNFVLALNEIKEKTNIEVISCSKISRLNDIIPYKPFDEVDAMFSVQRTPPLIVEEMPVPKRTPPESIRLVKSETPKKLSILICSLIDRTEQRRELLTELQSQQTDDVEILVEVDSGEISIGQKRNLLLSKACGEYVVFVDDDDEVSQDYVEKILNALKSSPDCCQIEGRVEFRRRHISRKFRHSIQYDSWYQENNVYYRCPNHLNPVRRELALQVGYPDISKGEDENYSMRLYPLLKTEVNIEGILYYYLTK